MIIYPLSKLDKNKSKITQQPNFEAITTQALLQILFLIKPSSLLFF